MSRTLRWTAAALVLALLSTSAGHALPLLSPPAARAQPAGWLDAAWAWLAGLFAPPGAPQQTQEKEGCGMDPNGLQVNGETAVPPPPPTDEGAEMDPNG